MQPTIIRSLAVRPLVIPLLAPFGIAGGAQTVADNLLVTVTLADGSLGFGEAAPFPAFNGETAARASAAIDAARPLVEGQDARTWRRTAAALREAFPAEGSARCAIEMALLDALTRRASLPLWSFFGGHEGALCTDLTVTTGTVEAAGASAASARARGFSVLKLKVGGGDLEHDAARACAVVERGAPRALLLDANGGFTAAEALSLLRLLARRGVTPALFEQPVQSEDLEGLGQLTREGGVPIAADESAPDAAAATRIARGGLAHVLNIKPMKSGFAEALAIAAIGKALGLGLMIGGMVESRLAMSASACLAAGLGGFSFVDLDTPLFLAEDPFQGGYAQRGERMDVTVIERGHGVEPRPGEGRR